MAGILSLLCIVFLVQFGFILEKIANPYTETHPEKCRLLKLQHNDQLVQHVFFIFDLKNKQ